nr:hypothetical protein [Paenibacillus sp.]
MTGGKAALFESFMIRKPLRIVEFEATCRGVQYLLNKFDPKQQEYVITNVGTGTSLHHVGKSKHERIGGSGVGGGTLLGLAHLLRVLGNGGFYFYWRLIDISEKLRTLLIGLTQSRLSNENVLRLLDPKDSEVLKSFFS